MNASEIFDCYRGPTGDFQIRTTSNFSSLNLAAGEVHDWVIETLEVAVVPLTRE